MFSKPELGKTGFGGNVCILFTNYTYACFTKKEKKAADFHDSFGEKAEYRISSCVAEEAVVQYLCLGVCLVLDSGGFTRFSAV